MYYKKLTMQHHKTDCFMNLITYHIAIRLSLPLPLDSCFLVSSSLRRKFCNYISWSDYIFPLLQG